MPHLLHHLGVDANANVKALDAKAAARRREGPGPEAPPLITGECMDWGTLAVYTCPDSCPAVTQSPSRGGVDAQGEGSPVVGYVEEFVWRQPPP